MTIRHFEDQYRFAAYDEKGEEVGEIEYKNGGNNDLYATHTEVYEGHEGHEGKGIGSQLLDALAAWATERGSKIVPICPFVIASFKKYPEKYAAVIK